MKPLKQDEPPDLQELEGEYLFLRELGTGSTGTVYLARHRMSGEFAAVKIVRPRYATAGEAVDRLAREARTVARLAHPNIVRHHQFRPLRGGRFAIAMQYVAGETLAARLARTPRMPVDVVERVLRDIGRALEFAHTSGVVHRDIKPQNILIDEASGRALLSDFGIAKFAEGDANVTMEGMAIGTPTYMSPEQVDGKRLDGRSDLYSLGLVGWEMLTGIRPWAGETLYGVIYKQKHELLPAVELLRPDVSPRVALAIANVLQKRATMRLPNAGEFLLQLMQDEPTAVARARRWVSAALLDEDLASDAAATTLQFPISPPVAPTPAAPTPAVRAPLVATPPVQAPLVQAPVVQAPAVQAPAVQESVATAPVSEAPVAEAPHRRASETPPLESAVAASTPAPTPAPVSEGTVEAGEPEAELQPEAELAEAEPLPVARVAVPDFALAALRRRATAPKLQPLRAERRWRPRSLHIAAAVVLLAAAALGSVAASRRSADDLLRTSRASGARASQPRRATEPAATAPQSVPNLRYAAAAGVVDVRGAGTSTSATGRTVPAARHAPPPAPTKAVTSKVAPAKATPAKVTPAKAAPAKATPVAAAPPAATPPVPIPTPVSKPSAPPTSGTLRAGMKSASQRMTRIVANLSPSSLSTGASSNRPAAAKPATARRPSAAASAPVTVRPTALLTRSPLLDAATRHVTAGRYGAARALLDSTIALRPRSGRAYALRARVRMEQGKLREAWADAEMASRLGDRWGSEAVTAMVEARARDSVAARGRARRLAAALAGRETLGEDEGTHVAMALAVVGDQEAAAKALARIRPVTPSLWATLRDPSFDVLRRSARYPALVRSLEHAARSARAR